MIWWIATFGNSSYRFWRLELSFSCTVARLAILLPVLASWTGDHPPAVSGAAARLDGLRWEDEMLVFLGNLFLERTVEACLLVFAFGGDFMIENPLLSLLWATPQLLEPVRRTRAFQLDCDQCAFGTPWKKPTRFVCSSELLETLAVTCPGGHTHQKLKGKVWDPQRQQMVF